MKQEAAAGSSPKNERVRGALPSGDRCETLGLPCPHGPHRHSQNPDDLSCLEFLAAQLGAEKPTTTARSPIVGPNRLRSGGAAGALERSRYARASNLDQTGAALTYRLAESDAGPYLEPAQSMFPGQFVLNEQLARGGHHAVEFRWLKAMLSGTSAEVLAGRSGRAAGDIVRAVNASARRLCVNDLPRRHRDDLRVVASGYLGT